MGNTKKQQRERRKARIRSTISGTEERPRLSVFKSNKYLEAQVINDITRQTIFSATTKAIKKGTPTEKAIEIGKKIGTELKSKKVESVVFDRGGYVFIGQIKALADTVREQGIKF